MASFLVLVGLLGFLVGLVSVIKPLRFLRISTQRIAAVVLGVGFVLMIVGCAVSGPAPSAEPSASTPQPSYAQATLPAASPTSPEAVATPQSAPTMQAAPSAPQPTSSPAQPTATPGTSTPNPTTGSLEVHFIDVGQGDAILLLAGGKAALIDGGEGGRGVLRYLRAKGVQRLDLMVATHPHSDHIGGLVEVLQAIPVAEVVTNGQPDTTWAYEEFRDAIAASKAQSRAVKRGDSLQLGSLRLDVLHPTGETGSKPNNQSAVNNQSIVLRLVHGQTAFLFMGDAEREAEASLLLSSVGPVKADILKVGNHGNRSASSPEFLSLVKPQVAVYSGNRAGNTFGPPHAETLAALTSVGAKVYGTDMNGTILISSDGSGYRVTTSKDGAPVAPRPTSSPVPTIQR